MVANVLWEQRVAGSNPAAPTNSSLFIRRFLVCRVDIGIPISERKATKSPVPEHRVPYFFPHDVRALFTHAFWRSI